METSDSIKTRLDKWSKDSVVIINAIFLVAFLAVLSGSLLAPKMMNDVDEDSIETTVLNQYLILNGNPGENAEFSMDLEVSIKKEEELIGKFSRHWDCDRCDLIRVFYIDLQEASYSVAITTEGNEEVSFDMLVVNAEYTLFELILKCSFLLMSVVSFGIYLGVLSKSPALTNESNYLVVLAGSLILFNDPFFGASLYNPYFEFLSLIGMSQFVLVLYLYWVHVFQHYQRTLYYLEICFAVASYFLIVGTLGYVKYMEKDDMTYDADFNKFIYALFAVNVLFFMIMSIASLEQNSMKDYYIGLAISMICIVFVLGLCYIVAYKAFVLVGFVSAFNFYVMLLLIMDTPVWEKIKSTNEVDTPPLEMIDQEIEFPKVEDQ